MCDAAPVIFKEDFDSEFGFVIHKCISKLHRRLQNILRQWFESKRKETSKYFIIYKHSVNLREVPLPKRNS